MLTHARSCGGHTTHIHTLFLLLFFSVSLSLFSLPLSLSLSLSLFLSLSLYLSLFCVLCDPLCVITHIVCFCKCLPTVVDS